MIQECKRIYLCTPDKHLTTVLNGVRTETVDFHALIKGYSELSFTVDRFVSINGEYVESNGYEDLKPYMNLYLEDIGYFQMQNPTVVSDGNQESKEIMAYSAEKEFENKDWQGIKINTGQQDSIEYLYKDNIGHDGFAKRYVIMHDTRDQRFSFLHIILEKMSSLWSIGYVDTKVALKQIPNIEIDNENLYAVMTSEVAPRLSCIFIFDYLNYKINVYDKDSLDFDTGIFIGFRNLANEVNIDVDQDSIYTRFTVAGEDDLNVRYYNYGSDRIMNIDYFLGEPYMEDSLVTKYNAWKELRDNNIDDYVDIAKQTAVLYEKIDELKFAVPSDACYWKNWDGMSLEGLRENLNMFNKTLGVIQASVDDRPIEDQYDFPYSDDRQYSPKLLPNGEVDHEWYLSKLEAQMGEGIYNGYFTYKEIIEYIIPYINLAIDNFDRYEWAKETPEDAGLEDPTENWDLYGLVELEGVRKSYEEDIQKKLKKYEKAWNEMDDEEKAEKSLDYIRDEEGYENTAGRVEYKHIKECLGNKDNPQLGTIYYRLNQLNTEIDGLQEELDALEDTLGEYNNLMAYDILQTDTYKKADSNGNMVDTPYTHLSQSLINQRNDILLTEEEVALITTLLHDTDYTNSNILTTSVDTIYKKIDKEKELYDDAMDKLFEVSQPQYTFTVSMDNMLRLAEYEGWYDHGSLLYPNNNAGDNSNFGLLRFIHVGIRDDYSIKLRVIGYRWNPCEVTPDLQLEFSNMITSKSGRSDLVQLLELENNVGAKNSISIGMGNTSADQEYLSNLLSFLTNNSIFTKAVQGIAGSTVGQPDATSIQGIINEYIGSLDLATGEIDLSNLTVKVGNIIGTDGEFETLFSDHITSNFIYTKMIEADEANVRQLTAQIFSVIDPNDPDDPGTQIIGSVINTSEINADNITVTNAFVEDVLTIGEDAITQLTQDTISTATINATQINGTEGNFKQLMTNIFNVIDPEDPDDPGTQIIGGVIETSTIKASQIDATEGSFQQLASDILDAGTITVDMLHGNDGDWNHLFVDHLDVNEVFGNNADFTNIVAQSITTHDIAAKLADIGEADINLLFAENAFVNQLNAISSSAVYSTVDDEYVRNIVARSVTVADLKAGNITISDAMQIVSENGALVMNGTALQIKGRTENGTLYTGIQLGYDTNDKPSLIVRNEDGATILTPDGITTDAVADQLIVNRMIKDGSIQEGKLSFSVMKQGDQVDITQIYDGNEQWGINYTTFKSNTESSLDTITNGVKYRVEVISDNGIVFPQDGVQCVLTCRVYEWNTDITDSLDASLFQWTRISGDADADAIWNDQHMGRSKTLTITSEDVTINSKFTCTVVI